ncbi:MAG: helix-turn-helix transcriptional regulator [Bacteroidales bacterium]|nr:helix-turn-helix transcriptional regulator [Bacteroidales bacterium]
MTAHEAPHIGHLIKKELARQGRSTRWLSEQIGCTRQNMHYLLNRSFIYTDLLLKISDALDHDFFKYYSDYRKAKKVSNDV